MGGKGSGPPGNLNNVRHSWQVFWKKRALRPQDRWIAIEAAKYRDGLLRDRPDPTAVERHAIELASEAKAARMLIWCAIRQEGFTEKKQGGLRLVPAAEALPRFIGAELGALKLLGLERRAKPVQSLDAYLASPAPDEQHEEPA